MTAVDCDQCHRTSYWCECHLYIMAYPTKYVNVYSVDRCYGGPEEGGWWYDTGDPVASIPAANDEEAGKIRDALIDHFPRTGNRNSVLGGDDWTIAIEDEFAQPWPTERPYYE